MKIAFKKIILFLLKIESKLILWKYKPKIIVITGSVGKTSTKDALYAVFSKIYHVRKSEKSFNSEIGLPLTILGCPNGWNSPVAWLENIFKGLWLFIWPHKYPKWLILEVGIGKPGDMKKTASWLKTDIVLITAISETPAHIEFFNSRNHLVEEKSSIIKTLKKDGILVLNSDDETVLAMKNKTKNKIITYGFNQKADIIGSEDSIFYSSSGKPQGIIFRIDQRGSSLPVIIEGVLGRNHIYASLASLAIAFSLKLNMIEAINALKNYEIPPGRMHLLNGIKETFIIDDTYNSSPFACQSALKTLGLINFSNFPEKQMRKIAILGDMLELGKHTEESHKNIGKFAQENADILISVGLRAKFIKLGAIEMGMKEENTFEFLNAQEVGEFLKDFIQKNDLILIKGSQGMKIVEFILLDQENKKNLLVRQDTEWKNKKI